MLWILWEWLIASGKLLTSSIITFILKIIRNVSVSFYEYINYANVLSIGWIFFCPSLIESVLKHIKVSGRLEEHELYNRILFLAWFYLFFKVGPKLRLLNPRAKSLN